MEFPWWLVATAHLAVLETEKSASQDTEDTEDVVMWGDLPLFRNGIAADNAAQAAAAEQRGSNAPIAQVELVMGGAGDVLAGGAGAVTHYLDLTRTEPMPVAGGAGAVTYYLDLINTVPVAGGAGVGQPFVLTPVDTSTVYHPAADGAGVGEAVPPRGGSPLLEQIAEFQRLLAELLDEAGSSSTEEDDGDEPMPRT
jgi:hypothetical protein